MGGEASIYFDSLMEALIEDRNEISRPLPIDCAACGADEGGDDGVCSVCGKLLSEGYVPLDMIRSTYRMQGKVFSDTLSDPENLFEDHRNRNYASDTAWACIVYSIVPYLGIIFIPFAVVTSAVGYYASARRPYHGGRRSAVIYMSLSFVILAIQLILWSLFYFIPELHAS
jgi:hypothetical protein